MEGFIPRGIGKKQEDYNNRVLPLLLNRQSEEIRYGDFFLGWQLTPLPSLVERPTGVCPLCNQRVLLRDDGNLTAHLLKKAESCKGDGMIPVSGSKKP